VSLSGTALRMTVFIDEGDRYHHRPLYKEITRRAVEAGLAGATVLHGCEGFGASSRIHTTRILSLAEDLPLVVVIVDRPEKIRAFLPQVSELVDEGLIILDGVEVVRYVSARSREDEAPSPVADLRTITPKVPDVRAGGDGILG